MFNNNFKLWFFTSIVISLIPWIIRLLITDNYGFFDIFEIKDLNFIVIVICLTTIIEVLNRKQENALINLFLILIMVVLSSAILGKYIDNKINPNTSNLYFTVLEINTYKSIIITILSIIVTSTIQWRYYAKR